MLCYKIYVSGHVQGVGFRFFTYRHAQKQGLTGSVENLNDGRVKIIVCGKESNVKQFCTWLENGDMHLANITHLEYQHYLPEKPFNDFHINH